MSPRRLYFDHAASSPLRPVARAALLEALEHVRGNPSSAHAEGRAARRLLETARERVAGVLGCERDEVVFTSGGTESNALALAAVPAGAVIAAGAIEHPSLLRAAEARGRLRLLPVDAQGRVRVDAALLDGAALLSVALVNHELGLVQDLHALASAAATAGALVHSDACQALGHVAFEFRALDIHLLGVCAHKVGGPAGIGALVVARGCSLDPLLRGGGQESGWRAGTEGVALAHAFAAAAEECVAGLAGRRRRWRALTDVLRARLRALVPGCVIHSGDDAIPNLLDVSFPGRRGAALVHRLDLEGVAVSHGAACSTGSLEPSPVLLALGLAEDLARSAVRISLGPDDTASDVDDFMERLALALRDVRARDAKKNSPDDRFG